MNNTTAAPSTTVAARFGKAGTKVHTARAIEVEGRFGRKEIRLITSTPDCGAYTRPGSGWPMPGAEVTCTKCAAR